MRKSLERAHVCCALRWQQCKRRLESIETIRHRVAHGIHRSQRGGEVALRIARFARQRDPGPAAGRARQPNRIWRSSVLILLLCIVSNVLQAEEGLVVAGHGSYLMDFLYENPRELHALRTRLLRAASEIKVSGGEVLANPAYIGMVGLDLLRRGDLKGATEAAHQLEAFAVVRRGVRFYEIRFPFQATWPYQVNAPWVSALSQGLALELYSNLYAITGSADYLNTAGEIARSFRTHREEGGFARWQADAVSFEEFPTSVGTHNLYGGAIATLAFADYAQLCNDNSVNDVLASARAWWERNVCLLYTSPSPRDGLLSRMPSSA